MLRRAGAGVLAAACLLVGCSDQRPALDGPAAASTPAPAPAPPGELVALPEGELRALVPAPEEVPAGLVPLLQASGPRDAAAVAAFSADPVAASQELERNGFVAAYAAQYASPSDSRAVTAVVVRFASPDGARADLAADLAADEGGGGEPVDAEVVGEQSAVRRLPLPDSPDELLTVRFRSGATTWLLAWRAPRPADPGIPLGLARALAARA